MGRHRKTVPVEKYKTYYIAPLPEDAGFVKFASYNTSVDTAFMNIAFRDNRWTVRGIKDRAANQRDGSIWVKCRKTSWENGQILERVVIGNTYMDERFVCMQLHMPGDGYYIWVDLDTFEVLDNIARALPRRKSVRYPATRSLTAVWARGLMDEVKAYCKEHDLIAEHRRLRQAAMGAKDAAL